jgi:signal transduction histidine kinase
MPSTHTAFFAALLWSILAFGAYYFRKMVVPVTYFSTIIVDMLGITVLAAVTGGPFSPFLVMYIIEIIGVFYLGNSWQGIIVSLSGLAFFIAMNFLRLAIGFPNIDPFVKTLPLSENPVYLGSSLVLITILILFSISVHTLMSRRMDRMRDELYRCKGSLKSSGDELMASFHDLESVADRLKEQEILAQTSYKQLLMADKLSTLGWITAGMVNEFNNPLTSIFTDVESFLSRKSEKLGPSTKETFNKVLACAERIRTVVNNFSQTMRTDGQYFFSPISFNPLVERVQKLLKYEANRNSTELKVDLDPNVGSVFAVESQIEQMMINLIINGFEAIENGKNGIILLSTTIEDDEVVFSVRDSGHGIPNLIFLPIRPNPAEGWACFL